MPLLERFLSWTERGRQSLTNSISLFNQQRKRSSTHQNKAISFSLIGRQSLPFSSTLATQVDTYGRIGFNRQPTGEAGSLPFLFLGGETHGSNNEWFLFPSPQTLVSGQLASRAEVIEWFGHYQSYCSGSCSCWSWFKLVFVQAGSCWFWSWVTPPK